MFLRYLQNIWEVIYFKKGTQAPNDKIQTIDTNGVVKHSCYGNDGKDFTTLRNSSYLTLKFISDSDASTLNYGFEANFYLSMQSGALICLFIRGNNVGRLRDMYPHILPINIKVRSRWERHAGTRGQTFCDICILIPHFIRAFGKH